MKEHPIQASGYFDILTDEYALTVASGSLAVTFDFLTKKDVKHLISCLSGMLYDDNTESDDEQREADLGDPGS